MSDRFFDLYLFVFGEENVLYKLEHLSEEDAHKYAEYWFEMNELHDYILVLSGSTPWSDESKLSIVLKSPEWISLEHAKLEKA